MTSTEFYQLTTNPSLLNKSSLVELRQLVEEYPYFHAVRMLYLKNLAVLNDIRLDKELKKMAIYLPDRKKLFMLLNSGLFAVRSNGAATSPKKEQRSRKAEPPAAKQPSSPPPPPRPVNPAADYTSWLAANAADIAEGDDARLNHQELIDSFIEGDNKNSDFRMPVFTSGESSKTDENDGENTVLPPSEHFGSATLDDSYFTETLARVYLRQKKFDKALEIIRVLMTKYPEKSVYFADQIRYLERIINLNK